MKKCLSLFLAFWLTFSGFAQKTDIQIKSSIEQDIKGGKTVSPVKLSAILTDMTDNKANKTALNTKLETISTKTELITHTATSKVNFNGSEWVKYTDGNIASNGGSYAGTIINVNSTTYWKRQYDKFINVVWFGVDENNNDNTVFIQNAVNVANNNVTVVQETLNGISDVYTGSFPIVYFPKGRYKITDFVTLGSYINIQGDNSAIIQTTTGKDIFYTNSFYNLTIDKINFVGGKCQVNIGNSNIDGSICNITSCGFRLSSDYAINTFVTGGIFTHLSANLNIDKCYFSRNNKVLNSFCDLARISNSWCLFDKVNMTANSAAIKVRGDSNHSVLYLDNFFGVPVAGEGVSRVSGVRWVDAYGSVYVDKSRFGGEDGGIPIVYYFQPYPTIYPYIGKTISITNSWCFAGISDQTDSGILVIKGHVPQKINIVNNDGSSDVPYIINPDNLNLMTYFTNFEVATGRKAYNHFMINISNNLSMNTGGNIYQKKIPDLLKPYMAGTKQSIVKRSANQVIANGFVSNVVNFDNVIFDNAGCFSSLNPTKLYLPLGCTRATIKAFIKIAGHSTSEIITVKLKDSSGNYINGLSSVLGVNADDNAYSFSSDVVGYANGEFFTIEIFTNATANLTLIDARVSMSLLDYIN